MRSAVEQPTGIVISNRLRPKIQALFLTVKRLEYRIVLRLKVDAKRPKRSTLKVRPRAMNHFYVYSR